MKRFITVTRELILLLFTLIWIAVLFAACGKNGAPVDEIDSPVEGLKKIRDFQINDYTVSAWNETGEWHSGYTRIYFTVTDRSGQWIENAALRAFPEMDMGMMKHSTPHSEITKTKGKALYEAYCAFSMYSGQGNGRWYYDLKLSIGNLTDSINDVEIDVKNVFRSDGRTERKVIQTLVALDGSDRRYVVTLVEPCAPNACSNPLTAYIHERKDANTYIPVEHFTLKLDPRMPSMENHSSPNNVDLTWNAAEKIYRGIVNFSMTGYWRLNLILLNDAGETLYGNPVSETVEASSLYFEIEF